MALKGEHIYLKCMTEGHVVSTRNCRQIQNRKGSDDILATDFKKKLQETFKPRRHYTPNT